MAADTLRPFKNSEFIIFPFPVYASLRVELVLSPSETTFLISNPYFLAKSKSL